MSLKNQLDAGIAKIMGAGGLSTSINIISYSFDSNSYDDDVTQTLTGSQVISGLVFPINPSQGSTEALLLQEGKLLMNDKILYTGSVNISGNVLIEINGKNFGVVPNGIKTWDVSGETVFNQFFIRESTTGSLY